VPLPLSGNFCSPSVNHHLWDVAESLWLSGICQRSKASLPQLPYPNSYRDQKIRENENRRE